MHNGVAATLAQRAKRLRALNQSPRLVEACKIHYRRHPWDFIADWGMTYDPRAQERGDTSTMPFIPWQRQVEFLQWVSSRWRASERGLVEKSRDCGVTWLAVGWSASQWLFEPGIAIGIGSRKEDLVDKSGDPDCIFEKLRFFLDYVPQVFMPAGYERKKHSLYMRLINPESGASITGEAGAQIGRGGRKSVYFIDEAAFIEQQKLVDAALSNTTNCQIDISTFNGNGNLFYRKQQRFQGTPRHFVFDWRAQPLDARIATPTGFSSMSSVVPGGHVIGVDGRPVEVLGVFPQGEKEVYRVTFSDGSSTECCDDHLWEVIPYGNQRKERRHITRTMPLREIRKDYVNRDGRGAKSHRYQIPMSRPVEFAERKLLLDPYAMGVLLGDGTFPTKSSAAIWITIGKDDAEMARLVEQVLPSGCTVNQCKDIQYWVSANGSARGGDAGRGCHNPVNEAIRAYGLDGKKSHTKFIPGAYLYASVRQRLALLQGLLDADGGVVKSHPGAARLSTTSKALAEGAQLLAESLGGTGKVREFAPDPIAVFEGGRTAQRKPKAYNVTVCLPEPMVPFRLARKASAYQFPKRYPPRRSIVDIERIGKKPVQCIKVANLDGLYLTDHFIVTHNSDPRKGDAWYQKQLEEHDEETVAQEVDRDPNASNTDAFLPAKWVTAAIDAHKKLGFEPEGIRTTGFDPADTGDAKACNVRYGSVVLATEELKSGDITHAIPWAYEIADVARSDLLIVDADGMGSPAMKLALQRRTAGRFKVVQYRGSGEVRDPEMHSIPGDIKSPRNKDLYLNFRSQSWTDVRERFRKTYAAVQRADKGLLVNVNPDDLISLSSDMPGLSELRAELSRPKRIFTSNGKIVVESKKDMRARGVESPNRADALVMSFAENRIPDLDTPASFEPDFET